MLDTVITNLIRQQRPYYHPIGNPIKGVGGQYWLVFQHRDTDGGGFLKNIVSMLGFKGKAEPHRLIRIDPGSAKIYVYHLRKAGDLPSPGILRTASLKIIEKFLLLEYTQKEPSLLSGSFREIRTIHRRYNLPNQIDPYNDVLAKLLQRAALYRRSTAYFDSGVFKLYEEPLQAIIQTEGQIRLLMDWQGFTKRSDISELERLLDPHYRTEFVQRTLQDFLQGLEESAFTGTQIMAELVRLGFLQIKLIEMDQSRAFYHKKTGIFSDRMDNRVQHDGSDNFTRAAHSRNAESVIFLRSWDTTEDQEAIQQSIDEFDSEWQRTDTADLSQEFLRQVLQEYDRRTRSRQPRIDQIAPDQLDSGTTTQVTITGENLDQIDQITVPDNPLVDITITEQTPDHLKADITVSPDHPPQPIVSFVTTTKAGQTGKVGEAKGHYLAHPPQVNPTEPTPEFSEIEGFQQAIDLILSGQHGTPNDFLYWTAQQRPRQFQVQPSDELDRLLTEGILFEHQKSGAQHCLRVMEDFGVAVCADAVGLGKTRLASTVARLYCGKHQSTQSEKIKIAIIAASKLHDNWKREMAELGFQENDYELYNKNLMSRKGNGFIDDFNRYGGPDIVIIDEAHEGIRNYKNRIHRLCLQIRERDRLANRQRYFLLLTATPWNNRREDIYNILLPFLTKPEGFTKAGFPPEVAQWFESRDAGVEPFTDDTNLFRRIYRELFLQRTRQMLRDAMPDLNVYAKRQAEWLPVQFEPSTEQALEQIFTQFESQLYIPFADPVRYLTGSTEQRGLLQNQRRFFLQRAESSMYALQRTIVNFGGRIEEMQSRLSNVTPNAEGLKQFLLLHYGFESNSPNQPDFDFSDFSDRETWDEDEEEDEEDHDDDTSTNQQEKRQQLRRTIDIAIERLQSDPAESQRIYHLMTEACTSDLAQLQQIQNLLRDEFVKDHKREQVTRKVRELVEQGKKVLLISIFSDTVLDYYRYMLQDESIVSAGIGMAIGGTKRYYPPTGQAVQYAPHNAVKSNAVKAKRQHTGIKRQALFRLFAPVATCRHSNDRPLVEEEINILIGSETLSVGQNLQDADYLINIDLPWNPMTLEQRIGRIDRPKQHPCKHIHIYYANSESQLLRQASRLANLNRKLVGNPTLQPDGTVQSMPAISDLSASIYGDTLFDDTILPGYVEFIRQLIAHRRQAQSSLQEQQFAQAETVQSLYTQRELLFSEDVSRRLRELGEDYQANPIALGRRTGEKHEPIGLAALTLQYYGPNGEPIPDRQELLFWNDQTGEQDGYGMAIATAVKTPEAAEMFSSRHLRSIAQTLYDQIVILKQQRQQELSQQETAESITVSSERISKIQQRIHSLTQLPPQIDRKTIRETLNKLMTWKGTKGVQKLLKDYTDGEKSKLEPIEFTAELVQEVDRLNLVSSQGIKPTTLTVTLNALLIRA